MPIALEIVSPSQLLLSRPVDMVVIPAAEGDMGVLEGHAPVIVMLRGGPISLYAGEQVSERRFQARRAQFRGSTGRFDQGCESDWLFDHGQLLLLNGFGGTAAATSGRFVATLDAWSVSSRSCLSPQGELIGCST